MLVVHDGGHRAKQCMLPLLNSINKPFGGIDLLLDEQHRLLLPPVFLGTAVVFFKHIPVPPADPEFGSISRIKCQLQLTCVIKYKKIGYYIAFCLIHTPYMTARLWIQADNLVHYFFQLIIGEIKSPLYF